MQVINCYVEAHQPAFGFFMYWFL